MEAVDPGRVTALLKAWVDGDADAQSELIPLVYNELHRLARLYRRKGGGAGDAIQTTALVHEAYLRLLKIDHVDRNDRSHFLRRRCTADPADPRRHCGRDQRVEGIALDDIPAPVSERAADLLAVDDALTRLTAFDPRRDVSEAAATDAHSAATIAPTHSSFMSAPRASSAP